MPKPPARPDGVRLPAWAVDTDPMLADPETPPRGPGRVLVVDDDRGVRELMRRTLALARFDVVTAESGAEGLQVLRSDPHVRVVLLDLRMPDIDGWAFRREQRADPQIAHVPTIILSGAPLSELDDAQLKASDYLLKPVGRDHLISVISKYCEPGT